MELPNQPPAFQQIAEEISAPLLRYLERNVGERGLAEDLLLILHDLEGLTAEQTAEVSGCSLPTAKIRIHRARVRLKQALQQECRFYRDSDDVLRCDRKR